MDMNHTPGPWRLERSVEEWIEAPECGDDANIVCEAPWEGEASRKRWPANARLIAAAPDLLAALQELMQIREWSIRAGATKAPLPQDVIVKFAEMQIPAVDRARAAITKAVVG
jgi:hypothetical protein